MLEGLERDLKAVRNARDVLGDKAPKFGAGGGSRDDGGRPPPRGGFGGGGRGGAGGVLGKRRRDERGSGSDSSEVEEEVRRIPMPRDTPPPIAKEVLDEWYAARRERMGLNRDREQGGGRGPLGTNANNTPLGQNDRRTRLEGGSTEKEKAEVPVREKMQVEAKTTYEAKPVIRDLRKEAVAFVPAAVRVKLEKSKGVGGLVEPEEADRLEKEGYMGWARQESKAVVMEEVDDEDG